MRSFFHTLLFTLFFLGRLIPANGMGLTEALEAIPQNAGNYEIILDTADPSPKIIEIPTDRGLTSLTLNAADGGLSFETTERLFANGIPLRIGKGIAFPNANIYGGGYAENGAEIRLDASEIILEGKAGYLFGGGLAWTGGTSDVLETNVLIEEGAVVFMEVFGGGHAIGDNSSASVQNSEITLSGETDYLLGGGLSEYGGQAYCGHTNGAVTEKGSVQVGLFTGGSAADADSLTVTDWGNMRISGKADWVFSGDFAFQGGQCKFNKSGRVVVEKGGWVKEAYLGSFAADDGSKAEIDTAELMVCGTAEDITEKSIASDGASARTFHPAHFPCTSNE